MIIKLTNFVDNWEDHFTWFRYSCVEIKQNKIGRLNGQEYSMVTWLCDKGKHQSNLARIWTHDTEVCKQLHYNVYPTEIHEKFRIVCVHIHPSSNVTCLCHACYSSSEGLQKMQVVLKASIIGGCARGMLCWFYIKTVAMLSSLWKRKRQTIISYKFSTDNYL